MGKLYIICGHGAGDPGACAGGYTEAALVRKLGKRIKALGGSQVVLLDVTRNWYADGGIGKLKLADGNSLMELHLDSATASAKGGHVIIKSGFSADKYDKAIAAFLADYFPGRSNIIVKRSDLANVNKAAARGLNYRLVEVCFISNKADRTKLIKNMDAVATGLLKSFGIASKKAASAKPASDPFSYRVKVCAPLNVRKGAGTGYAVVKKGGKDLVLQKGDVYTIVQTKLVNGRKWGKLKSGAGWICLSYAAKL